MFGKIENDPPAFPEQPLSRVAESADYRKFSSFGKFGINPPPFSKLLIEMARRSALLEISREADSPTARVLSDRIYEMVGWSPKEERSSPGIAEIAETVGVLGR